MKYAVCVLAVLYRVENYNMVSIGILYLLFDKQMPYRIKGLSDFVHRPDSKELDGKNTTFWKLDLFPSLGEGRHLLCWIP
jgi:hypothetical protein